MWKIALTIALVFSASLPAYAFIGSCVSGSCVTTSVFQFGAGGSADALLLENGDNILLESGDNLLKE